MLVFDGAMWSSSNPPREADFAATAGGDRLFDLHYTRAAALARYRTQLAALRTAKAKYTKAAYRQALSNLAAERMTPTRAVWTTTGRTTTWAFFNSDARTGRLAQVRYFRLGWANGLDLPPYDTVVSRVWTLATQLETLVDEHRASAVDTTYEGRPALLVTVAASATDPAWQAVIDRQYGLALTVRLLSTTSQRSTDDLVAFHLERWTVNQPISPAAFVVRPDYRHSTAPGTVKVKAENLSAGEPVHVYPPTALDRVAAGDSVVPNWLPSGWRLAQVVRLGSDDRQPALLVYRRGLCELLVGSGPLGVDRHGSGTTTPIAAFDRDIWPDLSGYDRFVTMRGGVLRGAPGVYSTAIGSFATLHAWTDDRVVDIRGDLDRSDLLGVADSLRVVRTGAWGRSISSTLSLVALLAAVGIALTTAGVWIAVARRGSTARPSLTRLMWPLIGAGLVLAGACLRWHVLRHAPGGFALRGFSEPLGRLVIALALASVVGAAWRELAVTHRAQFGAKASAIVLAAITSAGCALALVYLPPEARFTFTAAAGNIIPTAPPEGWLVRAFSSQSSPSASIGLLISLLGVLFLLVGVTMLRGSEEQLARVDGAGAVGSGGGQDPIPES